MVECVTPNYISLDNQSTLNGATADNSLFNDTFIPNQQRTFH